MSLSNPVEMQYEDNTEFNDYLDSSYEIVVIGNSRFYPSLILYKLDEDAYRAGLEEFRQQKTENFKQVVFTQFPTPIAMCYYRYENSWEYNLQRLHFLRDTWEATINLIHALVVGEYRSKGLSLQNTQVTFDNLLSDSLATRLLTVERLIQFAIDNNIDMECSKLIPVNVIQDMRELNRTRNGFSHSATLSEDQAAHIISATEEQVLEVMIALEDLKQIRLIRYLGQDRAITNIRHERFDGYAMMRTVKVMTLEAQQLSQSLRFLNNGNILATNGSWIMSLKPFVHFQASNSGHLSKLCFYKHKGASTPRPVYNYEVVGDAEPFEIDRTEFIADINELRQLLNLPPI